MSYHCVKPSLTHCSHISQPSTLGNQCKWPHTCLLLSCPACGESFIYCTLLLVHAAFAPSLAVVSCLGWNGPFRCVFSVQSVPIVDSCIVSAIACSISNRSLWCCFLYAYVFHCIPFFSSQHWGSALSKVEITLQICPVILVVVRVLLGDRRYRPSTLCFVWVMGLLFA